MRAVVLGPQPVAASRSGTRTPKRVAGRVPATPHAVPRMQASLAVSGDGERWFLVNASPDLRQQIEARPILHPSRDRRSSPIGGSSPARMSMPWPGCCTWGNASLSPSTPAHACPRSSPPSDFRRAGGLCAPPRNATWPAVRASPCRRQRQRTFGRLVRGSGQGRALSRSRPRSRRSVRQARRHGRRAVRAGEQRLLYIPGCAQMTDALKRRLAGASVVLFDDTL